MSKDKKTGTFMNEVRSENEWRALCKKDGLIVVNAYPSWAGPCVSMNNFLKKIKQDIENPKLILASACSDKIDDLIIFRDQSQPTWLFLAGGGKPVKVMRGAHVPQLAKAIKEEFEHEMLCVEGKAKRNFIAIDDQSSRKKKLEAEAQRLAAMLKEEDPGAVGARRDSSVQLETVMSAYTIAVIQPFLLNKVEEVKQQLSSDFTVLGQTAQKLDANGARKLYRIPQEVNPPKEVLGQTTFLLLESTEIKKLIEGGGKPTGALQTADDWLRLKVGPRVYEQAKEHSPLSLHATYGKGGLYTSGVWCPRRYDDKRFILITYFPQFLVEKVLSPEGDKPKRYRVFVFPAKADNVMKAPEVKNNEIDVFAHAKITITSEIAERMIRGWELPAADLEAKKQKLQIQNAICLSVNARNEGLLKALEKLGPLHFSANPICGAIETAALFPDLKAKYEEDPKEFIQKFQDRTKKRIPAGKGGKGGE